MAWAWLSILAAFGQALGWALKKKALTIGGLNNTTGFVSCSTATAMLATSHFLFAGETPNLSSLFWWSTLWIVVLNILAIWTGYRAIDKGTYSTLMPFMSLTAIMIVFVEYLIQGTLPTQFQLLGIGCVVTGSAVLTIGKLPTKTSLATAGYFSITLLCYSIASPLMAVAVKESGSGLFAAVVMNLGITIGFAPLILLTREDVTIRALNNYQPVLAMILAGIVMAVLEAGPINVALESASASEVFALKRTMPLFSLILGMRLFQEQISRRHFVGTAILVTGSFLVVWFR